MTQCYPIQVYSDVQYYDIMTNGAYSHENITRIAATVSFQTKFLEMQFFYLFLLPRIKAKCQENISDEDIITEKVLSSFTTQLNFAGRDHRKRSLGDDRN